MLKTLSLQKNSRIEDIQVLPFPIPNSAHASLTSYTGEHTKLKVFFQNVNIAAKVCSNLEVFEFTGPLKFLGRII